MQQAIQKAAKAKWSKTYKCWYVTCTGENYIRLKSALENIAELEIAELKKFLLEKRRSDLTAPDYAETMSVNKTTVKHVSTSAKIAGLPSSNQSLSKENKEALQQFGRQLLLKGYSQSTIKTYTNEFTQFLHLIKEKPAKELSVSRLKDYFEYCYSKLHLSENTMHSRINALKFYYEQVLDREKFFWEIPGQKSI